MSHQVIASIYEGRLIAWAGSLPDPLRVELENGVFSPEDGETYLRAFTLPADTASNTLGGDHRLYTGVFQVSIVTPAGKYRGVGGTLADQIAALFPLYERNTKNALTVVTMTPVDQGPGIPSDTTYTIPVSFAYRADTN
ncbi:prophage PssSM-02 [Pseudomonas chlororaphis subsp. aurantiaca]|uniref:phage tail terminator-like protein n=1 Tax=Pseudomonas chlororaphis TaxID=587753 RepID=UPI00050D118C|nr:phage tail terminator-like protein [Pseudomonas chlororaphis]AIS12646.1 prophage PssSM-02 [Pseudomonas chlororaphis subsp. aurantiaca]